MKTLSAFIALAILGITAFGAPQALAGGYKKNISVCGYKSCYDKKDYGKYWYPKNKKGYGKKK